MNIIIDNRSAQDLPLDRIEELARYVLCAEGMPDTTELSVSFVDLEEITQLNSLYRDRNEPTDVLSFEMDDPGSEDTEPLIIGDVVINPDIARKHALLEEVSFEEELWILLIHGILHLVGLDHEDEDD